MMDASTMDSIATRIESLDVTRQMGFWALLMHDLTLVGRACYGPAPDEVRSPEILRRVNELQHKISAQIGHLVEGSAYTYPAAVLVGHVLNAAPPESSWHGQFRFSLITALEKKVLDGQS
jgi:hypothetical protein